MTWRHDRTTKPVVQGLVLYQLLIQHMQKRIQQLEGHQQENASTLALLCNAEQQA